MFKMFALDRVVEQSQGDDVRYPPEIQFLRLNAVVIDVLGRLNGDHG